MQCSDISVVMEITKVYWFKFRYNIREFKPDGEPLTTCPESGMCRDYRTST